MLPEKQITTNTDEQKSGQTPRLSRIHSMRQVQAATHFDVRRKTKA